jgi:hypothetical protein
VVGAERGHERLGLAGLGEDGFALGDRHHFVVDGVQDEQRAPQARDGPFRLVAPEVLQERAAQSESAAPERWGKPYPPISASGRNTSSTVSHLTMFRKLQRQYPVDRREDSCVMGGARWTLAARFELNAHGAAPSCFPPARCAAPRRSRRVSPGCVSSTARPAFAWSSCRRPPPAWRPPARWELTGAVPRELLESHDGPPLSWDDVLDLRLAVSRTCCPQEELVE